MPHPAHRPHAPKSAWRRYAREFRIAALGSGHDPSYVDQCLSYAWQLAAQGLPIIYDQVHLSKLVGVNLGYLLRCSNKANVFYRTFQIAKRSGKVRDISAPLPTLKKVQRWILDEIVATCSPSKYAHAFGKGCSIRANARFHLKQRIVVTLDIKDFFPSIKIPAIYRIFREMGYSRPVSALLSGLTTLDGSLPQGAPTSPGLSNLVCRQLDARIAGFCRPLKWRYTRYADDLSFSGDIDTSRLIKFVRRVLTEHGFVLHEDKTRISRSHQRQMVTGVVVNQVTRASRVMRRELRQHAYYIARHGLADHMEHREVSRANFRSHLLGKAHHVQFLNAIDRDAATLIEVLGQT